MATKKSNFLKQLKLEGYSERYCERAMKNCFCNLGRSQGGHVKLSPFFQPRYSTVLNEKYNNLPSTFSRCPAVNYYSVTVPQKRNFYEFQLPCIEFNVPGTNFSIKQLRGKKRVATEPDQINSILKGFRYDRTRYCLSSPVDRRENACPPVAYISDLIRVFPHVFQLTEK